MNNGTARTTGSRRASTLKPVVDPSCRFAAQLRAAFVAAYLFGATSSARADVQQQEGPIADISQITVTATRRPESIDRVPLSVAAYDQTTLQQLGAKGIADIANATPGVWFRPSFEDTTVIALRGIHSVIGAATTGVYIDDTPVQVRNLGAGDQATNVYPQLFDLERVEVLRGPQGTLFGAGSEGGNIRFITTQPSLTQFTGHARSEFAVTEQGAPSYEAGAAMGGPIAPDTLGFRIGAYGRRQGGYLDRAPYPGEITTQRNINSTDVLALNAAAAWSPLSGLLITPGVFYQREHRDDNSQYWANISQPGAAQFRTGFAIAQPGTDRFALPGIRLQWELDGATIYSNSSYLDRTRDGVGDYTFILNEVLSGNYSLAGNVTAPQTTAFANSQRVFTQELRVQSPNDRGRLTWTAGAFYQAARQGASEVIYAPNLGDVTLALYRASVSQVFGTGLLPGNIEYFGFDTSRDTQLSLFGETDLRVTASLQATAGLRVSRLLSSYTNAQGGPINGGSSSGAGEQRETAATPKFGLSYDLGRDWVVYALAAEGFRPGGGNPPVSVTRCANDLRSLGLTRSPASYQADSVWNYEVGSKHATADGRLEFSTSAYYIRWRAIQQSVYLPECGMQYAANLGLAVSKGFDLQLRSRPLAGLPGFSVGGALGYDDARYSKTVYGSELSAGAPAVLVAAGERLNAAPWQFCLNTSYVFSLLAGYQIYTHADYAYSSSYGTGNSNDVGYDPIVDSVSQMRLASARVGLRRDGWDLALFVKNIGDSHDTLWARRTVVSSQLLQRETFSPRTSGVSLNVTF